MGAVRTVRTSWLSLRGRPGFTLVELLVVIAIIGILMSLTLPAIQAARETARKTECANKIRQFGVAVLKFESTNRTLPTSTAYDQPQDTPKAPAGGLSGKGWIVSALPQMEESALYDQFLPGLKNGPMSATAGIQRPECRAAMKTQLPGLQCPSDMDQEKETTKQYQWVGIEVALTNYKGVNGDTRMGGTASIHPGAMPDLHQMQKSYGLFWRHSYLVPVRMAHIRDGVSKTFMLGEDLPEHNHHSAAYYANGDYASCHAPLNYMPDPPTPDTWPNVMSFRSRHPGGAQFSMADGSIQFVNELIDYTIYRGLSTKAGGEDASLP